MNATTKNLTALTLQTALSFLIVWAVLGATQARAWGYEPYRIQPYSIQGGEVVGGQIVGGTPSYQNRSRDVTVFGDPRGVQRYMDNGTAVYRYGAGSGPRVWMNGGGGTYYQMPSYDDADRE